jgi:predicted Zn finger-like uncharacterized protein
MRALCPTCGTAYTIPDDRIGPKGRKVRCTRCGEEWRVTAGAESEPPAAAVEAPRRAAEPVAEPVVEVAEPTPVAKPRAVAAVPPEAAALPPPPPTPAAPIAPPAASAPPIAADPIVAPIAAIDPIVAAPPVAVVEPAAAIPDAPTPAAEHPAEPAKIRIRRRSPLERLRPAWLKKIDPRELLSWLSHLVGPVFFVATCLGIAALFVFRTQIVAVHPDFAGLYGAIGLDVNLRGLAFEKLETLREIENGQPVLVVEGAVVNTTRDTREVPALRFALRGNDAQELYAWSLAPKTSALAAGDSLRFRTRLAAPPDQAADVQIRFVERRNLQAGLP